MTNRPHANEKHNSVMSGVVDRMSQRVEGLQGELFRSSTMIAALCDENERLSKETTRAVASFCKESVRADKHFLRATKAERERYVALAEVDRSIRRAGGWQIKMNEANTRAVEARRERKSAVEETYHQLMRADTMHEQMVIMAQKADTLHAENETLERALEKADRYFNARDRNQPFSQWRREYNEARSATRGEDKVALAERVSEEIEAAATRGEGEDGS